MRACPTCGHEFPAESSKAGIKQFGTSAGCCRCGRRTQGLYGIYVRTAMQPACQGCANQALKVGEYVERRGRQLQVRQALKRRRESRVGRT